MKFPRIAILVACLVFLAACESSPDLEPGLIEQGKEAVANTLRDPLSAQFRNVRLNTVTTGDLTVDYVCGEINGKNAFGGYVGFARFFVAIVGEDLDRPTVVQVKIEPTDSESSEARDNFAKFYPSRCEN